MSAGKMLFLLFALGLAIVFGASALDNLNDDTIYELRELAGLGILSFVFFGSISVMLLFSLSDAICAFMEGLGDQQRFAGNMKGARVWYDRCLWLQDHLLNNVWRRTQIAGKHVATFQAGPNLPEVEAELMAESAPPEAVLNQNKIDPVASGKPKFEIPPAVANSVVYKYAVAGVFSMVAVVHALDGTMIGALGILFVGVALNAYWLTMSKDSIDS